MKLGELKGAIRKLQGAPKIRLNLKTGQQLECELIKGVFLEQLDQAFPGGKAVETMLTLEADGFIGKEE